MSGSYLCVFHAVRVGGELKDIGDDPCFDDVPTWGICRPDVRKYTEVGDRLFFLGYVKPEDKYYVKGWFEVGEKIGYDEALIRFPNRANVIVSRTRAERAHDEWRYRKLKQHFEAAGRPNLDFLKVVVSQEGEFFQNPTDDHEIDNWKCRRIFHCRASRFKSCIDLGLCQLNGASLKSYRNYVVADANEWAEVGGLKIDFAELRAETDFSRSLRTPKGQHNVLTLSEADATRWVEYLRCRTQ